MPSLLQTVLRGPSERARQGPAAWRREVWGRSRCGKSDRVVPQGARGIGPGASSLRVPCIFGWVDVCRSTDQARELCVYRHSAFRGDPVTAGISRIRGPVQGTGMRQGRARSAFLGSRPWWSSLRPRSAGSRVEPVLLPPEALHWPLAVEVALQGSDVACAQRRSRSDKESCRFRVALGHLQLTHNAVGNL